ncbi:alpha/beta-hydrolase [Schizophyllum commune Tattone D]|nr:alpha/beta-hydrolase [Schizophyllum commune Tattone D]
MAQGVLVSAVALLSLSVVAAPSFDVENETGIEWFPCSDFEPTYASVSDGRSTSCGYYQVPLDWADESVGTAKLAVVVSRATKERKGTVFVNPGGPGASGVGFIFEFGQTVIPAIGPHYDIVSWEPRGSHGHSTPGPPACFDSTEERIKYFAGTLESTGLDIKGNLTDDGQNQAFYSHVDEMEVKYRGLGERCLAADREGILPYLGTAAAVRDLVSLTDYLEPGVQEINYWGFSYGTMLGVTFVNMFPDRVGRVVLQSCANPVLYADRPTTQQFANFLSTTDKVFDGFAEACAMGGKSGCALVQTENDTGADIQLYIRDLLDLAHDLLVNGTDMSDTLTSAEYRENLYAVMYSPSSWSAFANLTATYAESLALLAANKTIPTNISQALRSYKIEASLTPTYESEAIWCGDSVDAGNMTMRDGFEAIVQASKDVSSLFGPRWCDIPGNLCFAWPVRAVERYTGPWDKKLSNRILVIGNTADPITPLENSQLMVDLLVDSATLLTQDLFGHAFFAEPSTCTAKIVNEYFEDGALPSDGTVCKADDSVVLFPTANA